MSPTSTPVPTIPAFTTGTHLAIEVAPKDQLFDINIGAAPAVSTNNLPLILLIIVILISIGQIVATIYLFKIINRNKKYGT